MSWEERAMRRIRCITRCTGYDSHINCFRHQLGPWRSLYFLSLRHVGVPGWLNGYIQNRCLTASHTQLLTPFPRKSCANESMDRFRQVSVVTVLLLLSLERRSVIH